MRYEKAARNAFWGIIFQIVSAVAGFVIRTLLIRNVGIQLVSLSSVFTEVISLLTVSELGLGTAITYYLYKPLADNDEERLCRLMTLYRDAYRIVGAVVFALGLILIPFMGYIIKGIDISMDYIIMVYMLYIVQTSTSYLFNYKSAILNAAQDRYLEMVTLTLVKIAQCVICALIIILTGNFLIYLSVSIVLNILGNVVIARLADKRYPFLKKTLPLEKDERKEILKNVRYMFVGRLSGRITTSTDNLLISGLISTLQVGYYGNYNMFITTATKIITQISYGTTGSIGNVFAVENDEKCAEVLRRLTLLFFLVATVTASGLYACLSPAITLWIGADYVLADEIIFICVFNTFLTIVRMPLWTTLNTSGMFKKTKNVSIIGSTVNLIVSVILGLSIGMVGIFIGTTLTIVIQTLLNSRIIYGERLKNKPSKLIGRYGVMTALAVGSMLLSKWLSSFVNTGFLLADILIMAFIASIVALGIGVIAYLKNEDMRYCKWIAASMLKKVTRKLRRGRGK